MDRDSNARNSLRDGGTVLLEFLSGLIVVGSAVPLSEPLGAAAVIIGLAGAALLAHALTHVMHFILAMPAGLALAIVIYYPLQALID